MIEARPAGAMDVERFVRERQGRWKHLSTLLDEVERLPDRAVGQARLLELVSLYRQAGSDLNEARSGTANASLLARLNALVGRGYRFVYRRSRGRRLADEARLFFARDAPLAFRRERASVLALPGQAERLVPPEFLTESPRARVERIEASEGDIR